MAKSYQDDVLQTGKTTLLIQFLGHNFLPLSLHAYVRAKKYSVSIITPKPYGIYS